LGGQLKSAATPDCKSQLRELVIWYRRQIEIYNIDVHRNTEIIKDLSELEEADTIIIATAALPKTPKIKGIENAIDIITAHTDQDELVGETIVYCGGGLSACDSALEDAMKGKKVTIIEIQDEIAIDDNFINKAALISMLKQYGVDIYTGYEIIEITSDGVRASTKDGRDIFIEGDIVVAAFGMTPNNSLAQKINSKYHTKTRMIGDCQAVGSVGNAV